MFKLTVVTPERRHVMAQEIEDVTVPAYRGELNIMPGHASMITTLETGILKWRLRGESEVYKAVISWGYCEVNPQGVEILADLLDVSADIDADEAKKVISTNERRLGTEMMDDATWSETQRQIARARADIELVK